MALHDPNASFTLGPADTDTACLLIHGFSGTPAEMRPLGEALAEHNIRVFGLCLPGHGSNADELVNTGRVHWLAAAEEALTSLYHYPHVFLAGLSMGGVLSLLLAERHPNLITGIILMSTPSRFEGNWQMRLVPVARYFIKWFYPLQNLNFNNPKVQEMTLQQARMRDPNITIDFSDPQVIAHIKQMVRIPVPAIAELLRMTTIARKQLKNLRVPLCIIQSKRDSTVQPECAAEIYRLATEAHPKSLHWLERSNHVITLGPEKEEVFQLCQEFIAETIKGVAVKTALPGDARQYEGGETFPNR